MTLKNNIARSPLLGLLLIFVVTGQVTAAEEVRITGNVSAKCSIFTDVSGVYGQPTPNKLSTATADGGVQPIVRYDVASAGYYTAKITYPTAFSSSPSLSDTLTWTGNVEVSATSDVGMAGYEAAKVQYDATTEYDLSVAGTTWFKVSSAATYGYDKSYPAGEYTALVEALCVAN
jgi:hypothetical protein